MFHEADFTKWSKLQLGTSYLSHLYNNAESNPDFTIHLKYIHGQQEQQEQQEGGRSILVHKFILSAASGFFRGLFHSGMMDSNTDSYTFQPSDHLDRLDPVLAERAVEHVIQLLYFGNFGVIRGLDGLVLDGAADDIDTIAAAADGDHSSQSNGVETELDLQKDIDLIVQMLHVANFFEMDYVSRACAAILAHVTNNNNIFFHVLMPSSKQLAHLKRQCAQYLSKHKHQVFGHDTVSMLPYELLVGLLLHVSSHRMPQDKIIDIFNCWKTGDPEMREPLRQQFLDEVRFKSVKDLSWYESKLLPMIEEPYGIFQYMKHVKTEHRVLSLGLDASGKTTMLYRLKFGEVVTTIPTIGFNVETVTIGSSQLTMWDVGGSEKIRPLWRHYNQNVSGIVFVVDSSDRERFDEVKDLLQKHVLHEEDLTGIPILFCANKQDLTNACTAGQLIERLDLEKITDRPWFVHATNAITGDFHEGMEWLIGQMS